MGAIFLAIIIFCARVMRRGLTTLDEDRKAQLGKIEEGRRKLAEDNRNISAEEQIYIARRGVDDLLALNGGASEGETEDTPHGIRLKTSAGEWEVELKMKEITLKSSHKVLHGQGRWILRHGDHSDEFVELSDVMARLSSSLRGEPGPEKMPFHIARRIEMTRQGPGRKKRS